MTTIRINGKNVAIILAIVATAIALNTISPIFRPGILLNGDHPLHYTLLKCMEVTNQYNPTTARCPYLPQYRDMYTFFPPLFYIIILLGSTLMPIVSAYKLALIAIWLLIPCILFGFFYHLNRPWAAATSFITMIFMQSHVSTFGFDYLFLWGGVAQTLGWGFFITSLWCVYICARKPTSLSTALLTLSSTSLLLAHLPTYLMFLLILVIICIIYKGLAKKMIVTLIFTQITACAISSFWLIPFAVNASFAVHHGLAAFGGTTPSFTGWQHLGSIPPPIIIVGILGLILASLPQEPLRHLTLLLTILAISVAVFNMTFPSFSSLLQFSRILQLVTVAISFGTGIFIETLARNTQPPGVSATIRRFFAASLLVLISAQSIANVDQASQLLLTSQDTRFGISYSEIYKQLAPLLNNTTGRILLPDYYNQGDFAGHNYTRITLLSSTRGLLPIPVLLRKPGIIGRISVPNTTTQLFPIESYTIPSTLATYLDTPADTSRTLDMLQIDSALSLGNSWSDQFDYLPKQSLLQGPELFTAPHSSAFTFISSSGTLANETTTTYTYSVFTTSTQPSTLLVKEWMWPSWNAYIDDIPTPIQSNNTMMSIVIPPGNHHVLYIWQYRWYHIIGLAISTVFLSLFIIWALWKCYQDRFRPNREI